MKEGKDKDKGNIRFSMKVLVENEFGGSEKNIKTSRATKRSQKKSGGKYKVRIVNGVKYMTLR